MIILLMNLFTENGSEKQATSWDSLLSSNLNIRLISLTNRFYVAVPLFSNRSQMASKCGKNAKCVTDVLTTLSSVIY